MLPLQVFYKYHIATFFTFILHKHTLNLHSHWMQTIQALEVELRSHRILLISRCTLNWSQPLYPSCIQYSNHWSHEHNHHTSKSTVVALKPQSCETIALWIVQIYCTHHCMSSISVIVGWYWGVKNYCVHFVDPLPCWQSSFWAPFIVFVPPFTYTVPYLFPFYLHTLSCPTP